MPATSDNTASTISGTVMISGDSWGWTPGSQRLVPQNVMNISRVM